jgi:ABC-type enterochelin transport system substrate-binding protein
LYDLGQEDKIIGITKFVCIRTILDQQKRVGVPKKVHYEKIRLLKPDIIICNKEDSRNC